MTRALALSALLAACTSTTGTLAVELATAPGSTLLSAIDRVSLTLTNPPATFEATRTADGLDLAFEIEAVQSNGAIYIDGFDASGSRVAVGQSPPFPLAGSDGRVVIYVAPPYSILPAPTELAPARAQIGATDVIYGAVLAGGLDAAGAPSASMAIYNIYDHTIGYGEDMPVRRASVTLAANDTAGVYVLGGTDDAAAATSTLHRFQTNVAPDGAYVDLGVHPGLESAGQRAIELGTDTFFITGARPALLTASSITAISSLPAVPSTATLATSADGEPLAAFASDGAVGLYTRSGATDAIPLPTEEPGRAIAAGTEAGTAVVIGGATQDLLVVTFVSRSVVTRPAVLSAARRGPTVAATSRHILVANGVDENGDVIASADVLDATTLALVATIPLAARAHTVAIPMPNDQIMIVGGDEPTGLVELFTPAPPASR